MNFQNIDLAKAYEQLEQKAAKIFRLSGLTLDDIIEQLRKGYIFAQPVKPPRARIWEENAELLSKGVFGDLSKYEYIETLIRYWKAQERAGYPLASEDVKYFESLIAEREGKV